MSPKSCFVLVDDIHGYECKWQGNYTIRDYQTPQLITWSVFKTGSFVMVSYGGMEGWRFDIPGDNYCDAWKMKLDQLNFLTEDNSSLAYRVLKGEFTFISFFIVQINYCANNIFMVRIIFL